MTRRLAAVACVALACGASGGSRTTEVFELETTALAGTPVDVIELDDVVVVLEGQVARIMRGGNVKAIARAPQPWLAGAVIPALDGEGRWLIGLDRGGTLWQIALDGELRSINDQLGLDRSAARSIGAFDRTFAAGFDRGIAASGDLVHMTMFESPVPTALAVARDRIAVLNKEGVELWDLKARTRIRFDVRAAVDVAFLEGKAPRLVVMSADHVFLEKSGGLRKLSGPSHPRSLAVSSQLWVLADDGLYTLEDDDLVHADRARLDPKTSIFRSNTGDVWVAGAGKLRRIGRRPSDALGAWRTDIEPIVKRACVPCHRPGGDADFDLMSFPRWTSHHEEIQRRVIVEHSMPPNGSALSDDDRARIGRWLEVMSVRTQRKPGGSMVHSERSHGRLP